MSCHFPQTNQAERCNAIQYIHRLAASQCRRIDLSIDRIRAWKRRSQSTPTKNKIQNRERTDPMIELNIWRGRAVQAWPRRERTHQRRSIILINQSVGEGNKKRKKKERKKKRRKTNLQGRQAGRRLRQCQSTDVSLPSIDQSQSALSCLILSCLVSIELFIIQYCI